MLRKILPEKQKPCRRSKTSQIEKNFALTQQIAARPFHFLLLIYRVMFEWTSSSTLFELQLVEG
jgi:hypothetical protein